MFANSNYPTECAPIVRAELRPTSYRNHRRRVSLALQAGALVNPAKPNEMVECAIPFDTRARRWRLELERQI